MHLRCEVCGGPENWCLDVAGEVWVRCMDEGCSAYRQVEMWPEEPFWPERVADAPERDDRNDSLEEDPSDTLTAIRAVDPSF